LGIFIEGPFENNEVKLIGLGFYCLFSSFSLKMFILKIIGADEFVSLAPIFELIFTFDP